MEIFIVGAGQVGYTLAKHLSEEGHSITVIDADSDSATRVANTLDVITEEGNGAAYDVQIEAGIDKADLLIAVTNSDEVNMLCCLVARRLGAKSTIARVRDPQYRRQVEYLRDDLGLSMAINPEQAAADEISRIIRFPAAIKVEPFANGRAELVELRLSDDNMLNGIALRDIPSVVSAKVLVCAVQRGERTFIPSGDFVLQGGDKLSLVASPKNTQVFSQSTGCTKASVRTIMIVGGGRIALYLAQNLLAMGMRVLIIERDKERCEMLSYTLPKAAIVCGDGNLPDLLQEEGLEQTDAFVALTDSDKSNCLIAMYAQSCGVKKVVTKVGSAHYITLLERVGVDSVIMPKKITSQHILQYVIASQNTQGSNVETLYHIADGTVEALEFRAKDKARCLHTPLKSIAIRSDILVAAIIRNDLCIIPGGDDEIQADDRVIVVTSKHKLRDLDDILI